MRIAFAPGEDLAVAERGIVDVLAGPRRKVRLVDEALAAVVGIFLAAADELFLWIVDDDRVMRDRADVVVVPLRRFVRVVTAGIDGLIALVINREAVCIAVAVIVQVKRRALEGSHGSIFEITAGDGQSHAI